MDSSSWQLRGSFFGFQSAKAKRDLTGSSHFSLKPHKHKLAENKVTAEKQALFKASYIPLWSQKRWKIILLALRLKILHIHKEVIHWLFMDSQRFQRRLKKNSLFFVFLYRYTVFVRTSVSGDDRMFFLCSFLQFVHLLRQTGVSIAFLAVLL